MIPWLTQHLAFFPARWPDFATPAAFAAWCQFLSLIVTAGGLAFVYIQIRSLTKQHTLATNAATSQLYAQVSNAMHRVSGVFNDRPSLVKYFYEDAPAPSLATHAILRTRLNSVCELVMDMVDAVIEQRRSLPSDVSMDWSTWDCYFRYFFAHSPILREFVDENRDFYPDYLFAALGHLVVRDPVTGQVISRWNVRELDPDAAKDTDVPGIGPVASIIAPETLPAPGYPWLRTWLIVRQAGATGTDRATAAVVAAAKGVSTTATAVTVRPRVAPAAAALKDRELNVVLNWVVGTMEGSGVKTIEFSLPNGPRRIFTFPGPTVPNGVCSFLVPEYQPHG